MDIGVLKTLGFTPRQVAVSVATGTAALALAAVVLGVPPASWWPRPCTT